MVDGFRLGRRLTSSVGLGTVYEATAESGGLLAITIFNLRLSDRRAVRRFDRAVRARSSVRHPGLLPVRSFGQASTGPYLVTELWPARALAGVLKEGGPLEPRAVVAALSPVGWALDAALAMGVIPGDLSPEAILVAERDGRGLLGDIGLAKSVVEREALHLLTEADYTSPEQVRHEPANPRSSVYSLTCVLYECLTGTPPFDYDESALALYGHVALPPPRATERNPRVPAGIDSVVETGMAKEPESRFATPGELMEAAANALGLDHGPDGALDDRSAVHQSRGGRALDWPLPARPLPKPPPMQPSRPKPEEEVESTVEPSAAALRGRATRDRRLSRRTLGMAFVAVVAAASAFGFLTGRPEGPRVQPRAVAGEGVALTVPADWQRQSSPSVVPTLGLRGVAAAGPTASEAAGVIVGSVGAGGPSLLSETFLRRIGRVPRREAVRLGRQDAYRYQGLEGPAGLRLTIYAVPTTAGVATVVCHAPGRAAARFMPGCARVAATLRLVGRRPYRLGVDGRYLAWVDSALTSLRRKRSVSRRRLARARGRRAQATWIARLERSYRSAGVRLRDVPTPPQSAGAHSVSLRALAYTQTAYRRLKRATLRGRPEGYDRARRAVGQRERRLDRALRAATTTG